MIVSGFVATAIILGRAHMAGMVEMPAREGPFVRNILVIVLASAALYPATADLRPMAN
jgi:hypothetical protein